MKKVWILNHYCDPPGVGKFTRHYHFAKNLIKRGYDVKMFTASTIHTTDINFISDRDSSKEMEMEGVHYVFIRTSNYRGNSTLRMKNMCEYALRLPFVTAKFGEPDIVIASSPHPLTWLSALRVARRSGARFIVETRDLWPETFVSAGKMKRGSLPARILYGMEKFIYRRADARIFTMPGGEDYLKDIGLGELSATTIGQGIDLSAFDREAKEKILPDSDLDSEQGFPMLYTGALGVINNIPGLLNTMKYLKDDPDIQLIIYGAGGMEEEMKEMIRRENLTNVKFKGKVKKEYIPGLLKRSRLNIIPGLPMEIYRKYGVSMNKIPEYLAAGVPILSTVDFRYNMIEQAKAGRTVKEGKEEAAAEAIRKMAELYRRDRASYDEMARNARACGEKFDYSDLTERLIELF